LENFTIKDCKITSVGVGAGGGGGRGGEVVRELRKECGNRRGDIYLQIFRNPGIAGIGATIFLIMRISSSH
jgi:hypothetical protein